MKKHVLVCVLSICVAFGALGQVSYQWVKSVGGLNSDVGKNVVTDMNGNVYISTLLSSSLGYDVNLNPYGTTAYNVSTSQTGNCAIAKYDSEGNCLWTNSFNGNGIIDITFIVNNIVVSGAGDYLYVSGGFMGFVNFGDTTLNSASVLKPFIAKFDANDGALIWVTDLNISNAFVSDIAIRPFLPYVVFAANVGAGQEVIFGKCDEINGDMLLQDTLKNIGSIIIPNAIALDAGNNITLTGSYSGILDFDPSNLVDIHTSNAGSMDIFIAQYTISCDYIWSKSYGGPLADVGTSIAFNSVGDSIYLAGLYQSGIDFGQGTINVSGANNLFVAKCDNNSGDVTLLSKVETINLSDSIVCSGISVDGMDNIYITGAYKGKARFYNNMINDTLASNSSSDIFFAKYNSGLLYKWSKSLGGDTADAATDIAVHNENLYITGYFNKTVDFNVSEGVANRTVAKEIGSPYFFKDIFVLKYAIGSSTIKGTVTYGANYDTINTGNDNRVQLYTQTLFDGNLALNLIAETQIDPANGFYIFDDIPDGEYLALAVPGDYFASAKYLIPTYYTNISNDTAFQWQAADTINAQSTAPAFIANINMLQGIPLTGDATLGGVIMAEEAYFRELKPIAGGSVVVRKNPGHSLVANTETDEYGTYSFSNLPALTNDTCYRLYVNLAGLPMISNYSPCPGQGDSIMNLNFVVDSTTIDTAVSIVNSVSQIKTLKTPLIVYPNPNNGFVTIELAIAEPLFVRIEAYSLLGKKVADIYSDYQPAGLAQYKYNAADKGLKAGVYFLNVSIGNEKIIRKIVQVD